jgi:predicted nucleotidyltransferase component of viral defense system
MNSFVKLSAEERYLYCRQAAERMDVPLPAAVIEKDFWVCWTLNALNEILDLQGNITFKGGTSLSKAWGLYSKESN